ncbi:TetR/AcrR family transcriptional regulator [Gryllotalpicola koreensis]|uniref:TetR/AcrR family transcriptional regulator n=1 Tax=Gryllotalpicola koreensis TaxID=993086 RepID=A0ABP7ZSP5_9MICO
MTQPEMMRRKPRGPYFKTEQKRREILDAALEVFAVAGYRSGSLRSVAQRVGMSEAGLLHHFHNKTALLAAALERRDDQTRKRFDFDGLRGRELVTALIELVEYNASVPGVVELFTVLSAEATHPEHPAHEYFRERYSNLRQTLIDTFAELQADGELRQGVDPAAAARGVIALMDGLQVQWLYRDDELDMAADLRRYFDSLLNTPL